MATFEQMIQVFTRILTPAHFDLACLNAVAEGLGLEDGKRGVAYYLTEAQTLVKEWPGLCLDVLSVAIRQDDCTEAHKVLIRRARRAIRKVAHD